MLPVWWLFKYLSFNMLLLCVTIKNVYKLLKYICIFSRCRCICMYLVFLKDELTIANIKKDPFMYIAFKKYNLLLSHTKWSCISANIRKRHHTLYKLSWNLLDSDGDSSTSSKDVFITCFPPNWVCFMCEIAFSFLYMIYYTFGQK